MHHYAVKSFETLLLVSFSECSNLRTLTKKGPYFVCARAFLNQFGISLGKLHKTFGIFSKLKSVCLFYRAHKKDNFPYSWNFLRTWKTVKTGRLWHHFLCRGVFIWFVLFLFVPTVLWCPCSTPVHMERNVLNLFSPLLLRITLYTVVKGLFTCAITL